MVQGNVTKRSDIFITSNLYGLGNSLLHKFFRLWAGVGVGAARGAKDESDDGWTARGLTAVVLIEDRSGRTAKQRQKGKSVPGSGKGISTPTRHPGRECNVHRWRVSKNPAPASSRSLQSSRYCWSSDESFRGRRVLLARSTMGLAARASASRRSSCEATRRGLALRRRLVSRLRDWDILRTMEPSVADGGGVVDMWAAGKDDVSRQQMWRGRYCSLRWEGRKLEG